MEEVIVTAPTEEIPVEAPVVAPTIGIVSGCKRLNIRKRTSTAAEVLTVVNVGSELVIDVQKSKTYWWYVRTADGVEGFCMKEYVTVK